MKDSRIGCLCRLILGVLCALIFRFCGRFSCLGQVNIDIHRSFGLDFPRGIYFASIARSAWNHNLDIKESRDFFIYSLILLCGRINNLLLCLRKACIISLGIGFFCDLADLELCVFRDAGVCGIVQGNGIVSTRGSQCAVFICGFFFRC